MNSPFDKGDLLDFPQLFPKFPSGNQPLIKQQGVLPDRVVEWLAARDLLKPFQGQKTTPFLQDPLYAQMFLRSAINQGYTPKDLGVDVRNSRIVSIPFTAKDGTRYPSQGEPSFIPGQPLVNTIKGMNSSVVNDRFADRKRVYSKYNDEVLNTFGSESLEEILAYIDNLPVARGTIDGRWVTPLQADARIPVLYEAAKSVDNRNIPRGVAPNIPPDIEGTAKNVLVNPGYVSSRLVEPEKMKRFSYSKLQDPASTLVYVGVGKGTVGKYNTHEWASSPKILVRPDSPYVRSGVAPTINSSVGLLREPDAYTPTVAMVRPATTASPALYVNPFDPSNPNTGYLREALQEGRANIQDLTHRTPFTSRQPISHPYTDGGGRLVIPPLTPDRASKRFDGLQLSGVAPHEAVPIFISEGKLSSRVYGQPSPETVELIKQRNRGLNSVNVHAMEHFGDISWDDIVPASLRRYEERWLSPRDIARQVLSMDTADKRQMEAADSVFTNRSYKVNEEIERQAQNLYDALIANKDDERFLFRLHPTQATPEMIDYYDTVSKVYGAPRDESISYKDPNPQFGRAMEPLPIKKDLPPPANLRKGSRFTGYDYSDIPSGKQGLSNYNRLLNRFN